ncbi:hypothetical protein CYMTET_51777, partial [Cymbomonas tetramitiformis]
MTSSDSTQARPASPSKRPYEASMLRPEGREQKFEAMLAALSAPPQTAGGVKTAARPSAASKLVAPKLDFLAQAHLGSHGAENRAPSTVLAGGSPTSSSGSSDLRTTEQIVVVPVGRGPFQVPPVSSLGSSRSVDENTSSLRSSPRQPSRPSPECDAAPKAPRDVTHPRETATSKLDRPRILDAWERDVPLDLSEAAGSHEAGSGAQGPRRAGQQPGRGAGAQTDGGSSQTDGTGAGKSATMHDVKHVTQGHADVAAQGSSMADEILVRPSGAAGVQTQGMVEASSSGAAGDGRLAAGVKQGPASAEQSSAAAGAKAAGADATDMRSGVAAARAAAVSAARDALHLKARLADAGMAGGKVGSVGSPLAALHEDAEILPARPVTPRKGGPSPFRVPNGMISLDFSDDESDRSDVNSIKAAGAEAEGAPPVPESHEEPGAEERSAKAAVEAAAGSEAVAMQALDPPPRIATRDAAVETDAAEEDAGPVPFGSAENPSWAGHAEQAGRHDAEDAGAAASPRPEKAEEVVTEESPGSPAVADLVSTFESRRASEDGGSHAGSPMVPLLRSRSASAGAGGPGSGRRGSRGGSAEEGARVPGTRMVSPIGLRMDAEGGAESLRASGPQEAEVPRARPSLSNRVHLRLADDYPAPGASSGRDVPAGQRSPEHRLPPSTPEVARPAEEVTLTLLCQNPDDQHYIQEVVKADALFKVLCARLLKDRPR